MLAFYFRIFVCMWACYLVKFLVYMWMCSANRLFLFDCIVLYGVVYTPELLARGKTEVSLRLYCSVKLATLYRLPLVEKPSPRAWPAPNTPTSQGELPSLPHELLSGSTAVESGRDTVAVLWGREGRYNIGFEIQRYRIGIETGRYSVDNDLGILWYC